MKFTIELTDAEYKGIKDYLKDVAGIEKPTKKDVQRELQGLTSIFHTEAVKDYISVYENQ